ncbi:MAG: hypothetical protein BWK80_27595 [Desulfobacteraceae bacterium IS3]|nr:MAG: hypothetical protein BWK80_27595 [Desulfobacteraceae bacterium IS3]
MTAGCPHTLLIRILNFSLNRPDGFVKCFFAAILILKNGVNILCRNLPLCKAGLKPALRQNENCWFFASEPKFFRNPECKRVLKSSGKLQTDGSSFAL